MPLPMPPVMMPLPSESCPEGRKRHLLVTESNLQLVRTVPSTLHQVEDWTRPHRLAKYLPLPHLLPNLSVKRLRNPAKLAVCSLDSPRA